MSDSEGLCSALFDTEKGTGICEVFGPHERHAGVVTVRAFRCHRCGRTTSECRCAR